ncbi:46 kDa FK506-binding nuclear protein-like [Saccostrea echinata]|uniref:46 kDa FK506-binding nuclear protein-like n=1 Tax=Saccostrea echinata TaxID=191078 RepID=UPI002A81D8D0|nr:46 kDa FK506-binding nuclear protein-like [Saccostrea echinata]
MVVLKEIESQKMFWGVTLDGGKRYTQTVERSFHISMAAMEPPASKVGVMVCVDKAEFLLCSLGYNGVLQQPLDLMFTEGEEVTFFLTGNGSVHLTGYLVEDQPEDMEGMYDDSDEAPELIGDSDEESDEDEDEDNMALLQSMGAKRKKKEGGKEAKKVKLTDVDDDDDEDEDDDDEDYVYNENDEEELSALDFLDEEASEGEDSNDEDSEDMDEEDISEEEVTYLLKGTTDLSQEKAEPKKKTPNKTPSQTKNTPKQESPAQAKVSPKTQTPGQNKQTPGKDHQQTPGKGQQTPANGQQTTETPQTEGKKKKKKKKNKHNKGDESVDEASTPKSAAATPSKKVLSGGIVMEETKPGHGPEAKAGKMVSVYYVGKLASNGKQFDSCSQGKPFKFRLGKNEVIKGWDVGLQGLKVGGKRRLTIPPQQAYGNTKVGHIPANSTLIFDVELKAVS